MACKPVYLLFAAHRLDVYSIIPAASLLLLPPSAARIQSLSSDHILPLQQKLILIYPLPIPANVNKQALLK